MNFPFKLPMVLDGATGTNLYANGMPRGVCVEKWVLENPQVIKDIQSSFVQNGSDAVYAPTFSANPYKFKHYGLQDKVDEYNKALVRLSKSVSEGKLVGGDMSPTGLFVEPFGDATFQEIVDIYSAQAKALADAGVDFFIIETMMSLVEARAAVLACKKQNLPIFVTVTVDEKGRTLSGSSALSCLIVLQDMGVSAFGLNCSYGPDKMVPIMRELAQYSKIPLIAKPNAGQPDENDNYDMTPEHFGEAVKELLASGVQIVGGCCGTTEKYISEIRKAVDNFDFNSVKIEKPEHDFILANDSSVFFLTVDNIEFTQPLECSLDMTDDLLDCEDDSFDVISVRIDSSDDAVWFSQNAHIASLPISFWSDDELSLKLALRLYNGKAMVDSRSEIEPEKLKEIADKYGAVVY